MIAKKCSMEALEYSAEAIGLTLVDAEHKSSGIRFRLGLSPISPYQGKPKPYQRAGFRVGKNGRRVIVNAVCWHGHRDFFRQLYYRCPEAIVKTGLATYNGAEHFERTFAATGYVNIGSQMSPLAAADACSCGERRL